MYPARHLDRALSAARHEQPVAAAVERVAQHVEIRGVVVDQQDPVGIIGRRSWTACSCGLESGFFRRRRVELAAQLVKAHRHRLRRPESGRHARPLPDAGEPARGPVAASSGRNAEKSARGQHRLQVLERGAPHVGVVGGERAGGDPHRLPIEREREKIEDVLPARGAARRRC